MSGAPIGPLWIVPGIRWIPRVPWMPAPGIPKTPGVIVILTEPFLPPEVNILDYQIRIAVIELP